MQKFQCVFRDYIDKREFVQNDRKYDYKSAEAKCYTA